MTVLSHVVINESGVASNGSSKHDDKLTGTGYCVPTPSRAPMPSPSSRITKFRDEVARTRTVTTAFCLRPSVGSWLAKPATLKSTQASAANAAVGSNALLSAPVVASFALPAASTAPPAGGIAPPAGGIAPPPGGIAPPAGGIAPPAGGFAPPAGGIAPPAGGIAPPAAAGGIVPPAGGIGQPAGSIAAPAGGIAPAAGGIAPPAGGIGQLAAAVTSTPKAGMRIVSSENCEVADCAEPQAALMLESHADPQFEVSATSNVLQYEDDAMFRTECLPKPSLALTSASVKEVFSCAPVGIAPPATSCGVAPTAGGIAPPAGGIAPPAGGIAPSAGGIAPPAGGIAPPAGGIAPPAGGVAQ